MADIEWLKSEFPMTELLSLYGWEEPLTPSWSEWQSCLCPFHDDHRPSASVNLIEDKFHCFTCGVSGDIFDVLEEIEGLELPEALEWLEDYLEG